MTKDRWIIAKETVLDVGESRPVLAYSVVKGLDTYADFEEATDAIKRAGLPIGWVTMKISQLFSGL